MSIFISCRTRGRGSSDSSVRVCGAPSSAPACDKEVGPISWSWRTNAEQPTGGEGGVLLNGWGNFGTRVGDLHGGCRAGSGRVCLFILIHGRVLDYIVMYCIVL